MAQAAQRVVEKDDNIRPLVTLDQLRADFAHVIKAVQDLHAASALAPPVIEDDEDLAAVTAAAGNNAKQLKRLDEIRLEQGKPHLDAQKVLMAFFRDELGAALVTANASLENRGASYLRKKRLKEAARRQEEAAEAQRKADEARATAQAAITQAAPIEAVTQAVTRSTTMDSFAAKASVAAAAPSHDLTRTRTAAGTASLQSFWDYEITDINTIDLNALRPFLKQEHIEQALRAFIKTGRREIAGARIFQTDKPNFRT